MRCKINRKTKERLNLPLSVDALKKASFSLREEESFDEKATLSPAYLSGFADGEGCFSISFRRLDRIKIGIEVRPSFSIGQKKTQRNYRLLQQIAVFFKGGTVRYDRSSAGLYKYETRSLDHIHREIIPFFQSYPLLSEKQYDFKAFCEVCSLLREKRHLTYSGLLQIITIVEKMNASGKRRVPLEGLRADLESKKRSSDLHK